MGDGIKKGETMRKGEANVRIWEMVGASSKRFGNVIEFCCLQMK